MFKLKDMVKLKLYKLQLIGGEKIDGSGFSYFVGRTLQKNTISEG